MGGAAEGDHLDARRVASSSSLAVIAMLYASSSSSPCCRKKASIPSQSFLAASQSGEESARGAR
jgi:hypothetical protein